MTKGFDLTSFHLNREPCPEWASSALSVGPALSTSDRALLMSQMPAVLERVEAVLHWAFLEQEGVTLLNRSHSYSEGVHGDYFIGRQYIEPVSKGPGTFIIETEICLTRLNFKYEPSIYQRYIVILEWDSNLLIGKLLFARGNPRQGVLATLNLRRVRTHSTSDFDVRLSDEAKSATQEHWPEILNLLQEAACEIVQGFCSSGQLDNSYFPECVEMTGEYYIDSVCGLDSNSGSISMLYMLHFLSYPHMSGNSSCNYLGYDLSIDIYTEGNLTYELWGSSSI